MLKLNSWIWTKIFSTCSLQVSGSSDSMFLTCVLSRTGGGQLVRLQHTEWWSGCKRVSRSRSFVALEQICSAATEALLVGVCGAKWVQFSEERHWESKLWLLIDLTPLSLVSSGYSASCAWLGWAGCSSWDRLEKSKLSTCSVLLLVGTAALRFCKYESLDVSTDKSLDWNKIPKGKEGFVALLNPKLFAWLYPWSENLSSSDLTWDLGDPGELGDPGDLGDPEDLGDPGDPLGRLSLLAGGWLGLRPACWGGGWMDPAVTWLSPPLDSSLIALWATDSNKTISSVQGGALWWWDDVVAVVAVQGWPGHGWLWGRTRPVRQVRMTRRVTRQVLVVSVAVARVE